MRNNNQPSNQNIVGYNVYKLPNGKILEEPIYDKPEYNEEPEVHNEYEASLHKSEKATGSKDVSKPEKALKQRLKIGKPLAAAAIALGGLTVMYGTDAGIRHFRDGVEIISVADAYQDFTELPSLAKPIVDMVQTMANLNGGK